MIENIEDAIDLLTYVKQSLASFPELEDYQIEDEMRKAYQFMNLAWNAREYSPKQYLALCADEFRFQEMGNFPTDIDLEMVDDDLVKS